jgi:hypothetical protein
MKMKGKKLQLLNICSVKFAGISCLKIRIETQWAIVAAILVKEYIPPRVSDAAAAGGGGGEN